MRAVWNGCAGSLWMARTEHWRRRVIAGIGRPRPWREQGRGGHAGRCIGVDRHHRRF